MASKPFSYLAPTNQAAPKTGFRKEEDVYGNIAASVPVGLNQQPSPPLPLGSSASFRSSPTGSGAGPPVAVKPMMMRHDRPSGFDADWRLRGNGDFSADQQPDVANHAALVSTARMDRDDDDDDDEHRMLPNLANNERVTDSSRNVYPPPISEETPYSVQRAIRATRPASIMPPQTDFDRHNPTYESAADIIRSAAAKNRNATKMSGDGRDELHPGKASEDIPARTSTNEDDVGGGIFENFILVGASGRANDDPGISAQHQRSANRDHPTSRQDDVLFVDRRDDRHEPGAQRWSGGGTGFANVEIPTDYILHPGPLYYSGSGASATNGGHGVRTKKPDRLPRVADDRIVGPVGVDNVNFDEPDYKLYSGVPAGHSTFVSAPTEQQYSPVSEQDRLIH